VYDHDGQTVQTADQTNTWDLDKLSEKPCTLDDMEPDRSSKTELRSTPTAPRPPARAAWSQRELVAASLVRCPDASGRRVA